MIERILARVEMVPWTGCWIWLGALDNKGYGRIWLHFGKSRRGRSARVHRLVYEAFVGPIPVGLVLDHRCRLRACCNPGHVEPVTVRVNTLRGNGPTAQRWRGDRALIQQRQVVHVWGSPGAGAAREAVP